MMIYNICIVLVSGIAIGGWNSYLFYKTRMNKFLVTDFINNFPTTEELAKEIMKVKLPVDELPDDVKEKVKAMMGMNPDNTATGTLPKVDDRPNYMG